MALSTRAIEIQSLPTDTQQALHYLNNRIKELADWKTNFEAQFTKVLYAAPAKPRESDIVFADGTTWNPGAGRGLYQYVGGAWAKL